MADTPSPRELELERQVEKLRKVNTSLMDRVQRDMNHQGSAFSLFQVATVLEREVQTRTAALRTTLRELKRSNDDLTAAKEQADAANRAKSEFLANVSHEIRTPMNGVLGLAQVLGLSELTSSQRRLVGTIESSAESLLGIINDILDYSKVEAGRLDIEEIPFNLREVVQETMDALAERAHRKGLELVGCIRPEVEALVLGDPFRFRQVLTNLLSNAIKFTEQGEVILRLLRLPDGLIEVGVQDTGIGIPAGSEERIFEAFAQADGSMARKYGGTGLGLAIVKRLVGLMGGSISVESQVGRGTTFAFTVRLAAVASPGERCAQTETFRGLDVLCVDPSPGIREMLAQSLGAWGATARLVRSVAEALAELGTEGVRPDAVVFDTDLADHEALCAQIEAGGIPAIRLSKVVGGRAKAADADKDRTIVELTKPIRTERLALCLGEAMQGRFGSNAQRAATLTSGASSTSLEGIRVLLAEDNLVNREVAVRLLEFVGCRVTTAESGEKVLLELGRGTYDAVLMDCQMPGMDGFDASREIRRLEAAGGAPRVPIIALTANAMRGDRERCLAAGMDDFVSKPYRLDELCRALERWLRLSPGPAPARRASSLRPVTEGAAEPSEIDENMLQEIRALQVPGKPDLLATVVRLFCEQTPPLVAALDAAALRLDTQAVRTVAHSLKSSCACVGALGVSGLCEQLELRASRGDWDEELSATARETSSRAVRAIEELARRFGAERTRGGAAE